MKKTFLMFVAIIAMSAVSAQTTYDVPRLLKKLEGNQKSIDNPKKNTKAAVWLDRGNLLYQLATGATAGLYPGMKDTEIALVCGKSTGTGSEVVVNKTVEPNESKTYKTLVFPNYMLYMDNGVVSFWVPTANVHANVLDSAYNCYMKALSLDPKVEPKVKEAVLNVANAYLGEAQNTYLPLFDYVNAANVLGRSYDIAKTPVANRIDTASAYNAGYIGVSISGKYPAGNQLAIKYLPEAEKCGFDQDGELYYYLYHAYKNVNDMVNAEKTLDRGLAKYPTNQRLAQTRIEYYMLANKDLKLVISEIDKVLANVAPGDESRFGLYFNKAILFDKLGDYDNSLAMFKEAAKIRPQDFGTQFNMGIIYIRKSDALIPDLNNIPFSKQKEYDAKYKQINDLKLEAIPYFERALAIDPNSYSVADTLKSLYFSFRDKDANFRSKYENIIKKLETMTPDK